MTPVELNAFKRLCAALEMKWDKGEEDLAYIMGTAATRLNRYEEELSEPSVAILVQQIRDIKEARLICLNTIRNNRHRWLLCGRKIDFIDFLGAKYAPRSDSPLNANWTRNVRYWLAKKVYQPSRPL